MIFNINSTRGHTGSLLVPIYKRMFHWALYLESIHTPNYTQRVNTDSTYLSIRGCFTGHFT